MTPGGDLGIFLVSLAARVIGALAGVGGAILAGPALTILFGGGSYVAAGGGETAAVARPPVRIPEAC